MSTRTYGKKYGIFFFQLKWSQQVDLDYILSPLTGKNQQQRGAKTNMRSPREKMTEVPSRNRTHYS